MKASPALLAGFAALLLAGGSRAGEVTGLTSFTAGTPARAAEVNGNFNAVKAAVDDNHSRINANTAAIAANAQQIADVADRLDRPCVTGFARIGLWCIDGDGFPDTQVRQGSSNENAGSTATNIDVLLGLPAGSVRAVRVRTVVRETGGATQTAVAACVGSAPLGVSSILSCAGAAIETGLIPSVQAMGVQIEHVIALDTNGDLHTMCAWGRGGPDQATCRWSLVGYIE